MTVLLWFFFVYLLIRGVGSGVSGLLAWILHPLNENEYIEGVPNESDQLDSIHQAQRTLKAYVGTKMTEIFTPKRFSEYIGQPKAKSILKTEIEQSVKRTKPLRHILISGPAGRGKTTLVETIAEEAGVKMVECITSKIKTAEELCSLIDEADGGIVFLDEIHALPRDIAEQIYTMMERFHYEGLPIKPFTLIGATTELGELLKTRRPFYDRFKIPIELEEYNNDELFIIGKQYLLKSFPYDTLPDETITKLSKCSRGTPRIMVKLIESTVYFDGDYKTVLNNFHIIKDGYTEKDLEVLQYLEQNPKGAGLQSISAFLDIPDTSYLYDIEPYLLRNGIIQRGARGRKITDEGILLMKELQNV